MIRLNIWPKFLGSFQHAMLHGLAGCVAAEATGADCAAGAAGAVAQSIYAGSQVEPDPSEFDNATEFEEAYLGWKYQTTVAAEIYGAGIGFLLSGGDAANVTAAAFIAKSAYENNYLKHDEWKQYLAAIERCGEVDVCLQAVHKIALEASLANRHKLLMCGPDIECKRALEAEVEYLSDPIADAAVQALQNLDYYEVRNVGGGNIATSSVVDLITGNTEDNISYPDFYASRCGAISVQQCVGYFAREQVRLHEDSAEENLLVVAGLSAAMLTPFLAQPTIVFSSSTIKAITACTMNPLCWAEMTMLGGEVALGATNAVQGQAFVTVAATGTALAGKVILQKGDEIIAVLDDLGRLFRPVSQTVNDAGKFLVKHPKYGVGHFGPNGFVPRLVTKRGVPNTGVGTTFNPTRLADHFNRHGSDFGAASATQYQRMADDFLTGPRSPGVLERVRPNGDVVRFDPASDSFGVVSSGGTIRTFYKPTPRSPTNPGGYDPSRYSSALDYFNNVP